MWVTGESPAVSIGFISRCAEKASLAVFGSSSFSSNKYERYYGTGRECAQQLKQLAIVRTLS